MPTLEERVGELERRVSEWEGQLGFLIPLTRQLHREILTTREEMRERFEAVEARFDSVDARFNTIDARFNAVDARFAAVDARFDAVDARFDGLPGDIAKALAPLLNRT